jgi:hypothetical protein
LQLFIFQNAKHIDVSAVVTRWQADAEAKQVMDITFVHSTQPTGYFGRFLVPLLTTAQYWAVFDDDVIFGNRQDTLETYIIDFSLANI